MTGKSSVFSLKSMTEDYSSSCAVPIRKPRPRFSFASHSGLRGHCAMAQKRQVELLAAGHLHLYRDTYLSSASATHIHAACTHGLHELVLVTCGTDTECNKASKQHKTIGPVWTWQALGPLCVSLCVYARAMRITRNYEC